MSGSMKNRLRGAANPHQVLSQIRATIAPSRYLELLAWLPALTGKRVRCLTPPFPSTFESLMPQWTPLDPIPLERETQWIATRIILHSERINRFVSLKNALEEAWLNGDRISAEHLSVQIENECGASFFLLETRFALLQYWKGLEAQKSFLSEVRNQARTQIVHFTAYFLSQKNENATNQVFFKRRVLAAVESTDARESLKEYLRFRQFHELPDSPESLSFVLRHEANSSIVDQYETLLLVLTEIAGSRRGEAAVELISRNILDSRLGRLRVLYGLDNFPADIPSPSFLQAQFNLDSMNSCNAVASSSQCPPGSSSVDYIPIEALARCDAKLPPTFESPTPLQSLLLLLYRVAAKEEKFEDDLYEILRIVECYSSFRFVNVIRPVMLELATDACYLPDRLRRRYFVSAGDPNPLALPIIPPDSRGTFLSLLADAGYKLGEANTSDELSGTTSVCDLRWRLMLPDDSSALCAETVQTAAAFARISRQVTRRRIHHQLDDRDLEASLFSIAKSYLNDPQILTMLPITRAVEMINEDEIVETTGDPLFLAVVYDLYLRFFGDERPFIRNDAYEDFLAANGVERPSQLTLENFEVNYQPYVIYFLRFVCIPEVMSTSPYFETSRSLETERIAVCSLLLKIDSKNSAAYEEELREITRRQIVTEGLRDVERSKFAVDLSPLRRWAEKNLKESFARFQALLLAGVKPSQIHSAASPDTGVALPDSANDETATLLTNMIDSFLYESYTNSFYGLDSYLSLRARHGALSGQLRAPLEEGHIITQRAEGNDVYQSNQYWLRRLPLEPWAAQQLDQHLKHFSAAFDRIAKDFADKKLQIKAPDKQDALFTYKIINLDLLQVAAEVRSDSAFPLFVNSCIDVFWANLEESLAHVRNIIDVELRRDLLIVTTKLISDIETLRHCHESIDELISAIRHSQTRLNQSIVVLQGWFHLPKSASTELFTMDEIADISLEQIRRLHPNFAPDLHRNISVSISILELRRFSDMFFIIFENIHKHCGCSGQPSVDLTIAQDGDRLLIEVLSDFQKVDDPEPRLAKIREIIASGTYQKVLRSEGGTGLVKLWNIIRTDSPGSGVDSKLEFGVAGDRFRVGVEMPFKIIT